MGAQGKARHTCFPPCHSPLVGSSMNSREGHDSSAQPTASRLRSPPLRPRSSMPPGSTPPTYTLRCCGPTTSWRMNANSRHAKHLLYTSFARPRSLLTNTCISSNGHPNGQQALAAADQRAALRCEPHGSQHIQHVCLTLRYRDANQTQPRMKPQRLPHRQLWQQHLILR